MSAEWGFVFVFDSAGAVGLIMGRDGEYESFTLGEEMPYLGCDQTKTAAVKRLLDSTGIVCRDDQ
jgi:hypothetical protein